MAEKSSVFRIYEETIEQDRWQTEDGATVVRNHGCNGKKHVDQITREWYGEEGEVQFAARDRHEDFGACNGSCAERTLGRFGYPPGVLKPDSLVKERS